VKCLVWCCVFENEVCEVFSLELCLGDRCVKCFDLYICFGDGGFCIVLAGAIFCLKTAISAVLTETYTYFALRFGDNISHSTVL
jgi:hypothetical protein